MGSALAIEMGEGGGRHDGHLWHIKVLLEIPEWAERYTGVSAVWETILASRHHTVTPRSEALQAMYGAKETASVDIG